MIRRLGEKILGYVAQVSSKARSDFVYTGGAQGIGLVSSFFTALIITNRLGVDQLGAYALIISISTFLTALVEVGVGQTAIRYASIALANSEQEKCNAVLAWSINLRILCALVSIVAGLFLSEWLGTHVWSGGASAEFISHAFVLGAVSILQQCVNSYFHTHHKFRLLSLLTSASSALIFGGALTFAWLGVLSLELIIFVSIIVPLATFCVVIFKTPWCIIYDWNGARRWAHFGFQFPVSTVSSGPLDGLYGINPKKFAFNLLISSIIVTLFTRLDIWMIGAILSESELGVYKLASYFATPLALVVGALNTTLWPRAAKLITEKTISAFISKTIQTSVLLIIPMGFYIISLIWIPNLIFPTQAPAMIGLAIALSVRYVLAVLITPAAVVGYTLGMSKVYVLVNSLQLAVVFVINIALLGSMGLYASAIALIVADLLGLLIIWPLLRQRINSLAAA